MEERRWMVILQVLLSRRSRPSWRISTLRRSLIERSWSATVHWLAAHSNSHVYLEFVQVDKVGSGVIPLSPLCSSGPFAIWFQ